MQHSRLRIQADSEGRGPVRSPIWIGLAVQKSIGDKIGLEKTQGARALWQRRMGAMLVTFLQADARQVVKFCRRSRFFQLRFG